MNWEEFMESVSKADDFVNGEGIDTNTVDVSFHYGEIKIKIENITITIANTFPSEEQKKKS